MEKHERKEPPGRHRRRLQNIIRVDVQGIVLKSWNGFRKFVTQEEVNGSIKNGDKILVF